MYAASPATADGTFSVLTGMAVFLRLCFGAAAQKQHRQKCR